MSGFEKGDNVVFKSAMKTIMTYMEENADGNGAGNWGGPSDRQSRAFDKVEMVKPPSGAAFVI